MVTFQGTNHRRTADQADGMMDPLSQSLSRVTVSSTAVATQTIADRRLTSDASWVR